MPRSKKQQQQKPAKRTTRAAKAAAGSGGPALIAVSKEELLKMGNLGLQKHIADQENIHKNNAINTEFAQVLQPILQRGGITIHQWSTEYTLDSEAGVARRKTPEQIAQQAAGGQPAAPPVQHMN